MIVTGFTLPVPQQTSPKLKFYSRMWIFGATLYAEMGTLMTKPPLIITLK